MLRYRFLVIVVCMLSACAQAQTSQVCLGGPATTNKLICLIPGAYGVNGLQLTSANLNHQGHFENSFVNTTATPLSSAIGTQSSLLPLASPSSGLTFAWDPVAKAFAPSTDSLGPILGERAETVGRHRVFVGFSYQFFDFGTLDGVDLKHFDEVFTHQDDAVDGPPPPGVTCSITPRDSLNNEGNCSYVRDVIRTTNRVNLKINQFTTYVSFGLTNRVDVSMAVPIETVRMEIFSAASIVDNSHTGDHLFRSRTDCPAPAYSGCLQQSFSQSSRASGVSDITLRVKGIVWKGERAAAAVGADVRVPTGDELNFLGSGAIGVRPFVVFSYHSRISPHLLLGYESNESSVLAGDVSTGRKARLPSEITYSGGFDVWITKRLTGAVDLVGQQVHQARRISATTFTELGACKPSLDPNCFMTDPSTFAVPNQDRDISESTRSYNITNAAIGIKTKPFGNFLLTANVTLKLNDGGLRAKAVPLVGASYTF
jgi:hypothetical protein